MVEAVGGGASSAEVDVEFDEEDGRSSDVRGFELESAEVV